VLHIKWTVGLNREEEYDRLTTRVKVGYKESKLFKNVIFLHGDCPCDHFFHGDLPYRGGNSMLERRQA
jgi:hypothetical protein